VKAKEEMAAAAKAAQEEARNKSKSVTKASDPVKRARPTESKEAEKQEETKVPAPSSLPGLFDAPAADRAAARAPSGPASSADVDEESELLAEISEAEHHDDHADEAA
jgi:hypothetical protein